MNLPANNVRFSVTSAPSISSVFSYRTHLRPRRVFTRLCLTPSKQSNFCGCRFQSHTFHQLLPKYPVISAIGMAGVLPSETDAYSSKISHGVTSTSSDISELVIVEQHQGADLPASSLDTELDSSNDDLRNSGYLTESKSLPEEIFNRLLLLRCPSSARGGYCNVYVVGTAHVSQESCQEVQAVISCLKPQVVFLELCPKRVAILTPQHLQVPTIQEMINTWKQKKMNAFGILYSWFLAKVANKLEVLPGAEFRVAYEEAIKYHGKVVLGDRPVQVTLWRTWGKMPLWHKAKFLYQLLFQTIFLPSTDELTRLLKQMDDLDMLSLVIQEMSKEFPTLMDTVVRERDMYMSSALLKVAKKYSSVVAVVGRGHMAGIEKHWEKPIQVEELLEIPTKTPWIPSKMVFASIGVAVAGVFYLSIKRWKV